VNQLVVPPVMKYVDKVPWQPAQSKHLMNKSTIIKLVLVDKRIMAVL